MLLGFFQCKTDFQDTFQLGLIDNNFTGHEQLIEFDGVFKFQNQHESVQSHFFSGFT